MLLTLSNLFPRPDQPQRGLFNVQLFEELARQTAGRGSHQPLTINHQPSTITPSPSTPPSLLNVCLVPEWRVWRWDRIKRWVVPINPQPITINHEPSTLYCPVFYVPVVGRDWMWWTYYRSLRRRMADFAGARTVYAAWLYPDGVAAARLAMELAAPCWIMVQGSDCFHLRHPRRHAALLRVADEVQGFICVSRPLAETLIKAGIHRAKVHVVPNGVDGTLFRYRTKREAAEGGGWRVEGGGRTQASGPGGGAIPDAGPQMPDAPGESPVPSTINHQPSTLVLADVLAGRAKLVLFVGNLVPVKGPDVFLKSISLLRPTAYSLQPTVSLIIGDGPMRRGLEREARRLGLGESVFFLGSRPHAEVARWMNVADVLCLTSRSEGMPNAVIEALVSGLPVVVTDVGACRELVEDEPLARWCLAEDTQAVARAIRDVLGLAADRPAMAARHGARFSWARQARRILELMGLGKNG